MLPERRYAEVVQVCVSLHVISPYQSLISSLSLNTGRGDGKRPCSPSCNDDEVLIATSACDSGGSKGLCCKSTINTLEHCQPGDCVDVADVKTSCTSDFPALLTYSAGEPKSYCKHDQVRPMCCEDDPSPPIKNCKWVGTPPLCECWLPMLPPHFVLRWSDTEVTHNRSRQFLRKWADRSHRRQEGRRRHDVLGR